MGGEKDFLGADATSEKPKAGYFMVAMRKWLRENEEDKELLQELMTKLKKELNFVWGGPADKVYEMGSREGVPPACAVVKFDSVDAAKAYYDSGEYQKLLADNEITTKILQRDFRIFEGPADMFQEGKAYWLAWIYKVHDREKFGKYFEAFVAQNEKGFTIDGEAEPFKVDMSRIVVTGSDLREHGKALLGSGTEAFPGTTDDQGLCGILELPNHNVGQKFRDCPDYKNVLLKAFGKEYSNEDEYKEDLTKFTDEVFARDVRIVCL